MTTPSKTLKLIATTMTLIAGYVMLCYANDSVYLKSWHVIDRALYVLFSIFSIFYVDKNASAKALGNLVAIVPIFMLLAYMFSAFTFWTFNVFDISLFSQSIIAYIYLGVIIPWTILTEVAAKKETDLIDKLEK